MSQRQVSLLGGAESGKSTWIGTILDQADRGEGTLRLDGRAADARAFSTFTGPLLEARYPIRTSKQAQDELLRLDVPLRTTAPLPESRFRLRLADYAGEQIERIFEERAWSHAWRERAEAPALLLLIRHDASVPLPRLALPPREPTPVDAPADLFPSLVEPAEIPPPAADSGVRVPTALALVELLQFLRHERGLAIGERPDRGSLRVGVVFSAWDAADPRWRQAGPIAYAQQELPLLTDLLTVSFHEADVRFFGLSATGGDLKEERHRKRYRDEPEGFVEWDGPVGVERSADVSRPLGWALHGEAALRTP